VATTSNRHAKEDTMAPDQLLEKFKTVAQAFAQGHICKTLLNLADTDAERARLKTQFDQWDRRVEQLWAELTAVVNSALPPTIYALPDPFAPVTTPGNSDVELRGRLGERAVAIRLTGVQAVAVGTTLIACAAAVTDRAGGRLAAILPTIPAVPPGQPIRPA
jgi:hypothetical protein